MLYILFSLLTAAILPATTLAHYKLIKDYSGFDFVSQFDYYNGPDPSNGHVQYKGYATANATGLTGFMVGPNGTNANSPSLPPPIYLGVDYSNVYSKVEGRPSLRVSSVQTYNHSLIVADILHMPSSTCGVWPAFWMLGTAAPWPDAGEIDIIENVNDNDFNTMTLHTNSNITVVNDTAFFTGTMKTSDCDINAKNQDKNAGCGITDKSEANSYGTNFNENGGGVFAMQYTLEYIAIWFFPRQSIPADIKSNTPMPPPTKNASSSSWGRPNALFQPAALQAEQTTATTKKNTVIPVSTVTVTVTAPYSNTTTGSSVPPNRAASSVLTQHFMSLQILFSTNFCGDWAGSVWNETSCGNLAPTCEEYVSMNPSAFKDAFWTIQSVKVFENVHHTPTANNTNVNRTDAHDDVRRSKGYDGHEDIVRRFGHRWTRPGRILPVKELN